MDKQFIELTLTADIIQYQLFIKLKLTVNFIQYTYMQ